jgi:hypothetical protein
MVCDIYRLRKILQWCLVDGDGDVLFKSRQNYAKAGVAAGDIGTVVSAIFLMAEEHDPGACRCVHQCYLEESLTILKIGREVMANGNSGSVAASRVRIACREEHGPRRYVLEFDLENDRWSGRGDLLVTTKGSSREVPSQGLRLMTEHGLAVAILIGWGSPRTGKGLVHETPSLPIDFLWEIISKS